MVPGFIPRRPLRLGHLHHIPPVPNNKRVLALGTATILSARDAAARRSALGGWTGRRLPAIPDLVAGGALGFGDGDVEVAFSHGVSAGSFCELSALEAGVVVVVFVVVVESHGLPAVAGVVVGRALGFGDGDGVVAFDRCGLSQLALFPGEVIVDSVVSVKGLVDFGLVGMLVLSVI